jgi:hypothetical protein
MARVIQHVFVCVCLCLCVCVCVRERERERERRGGGFLWQFLRDQWFQIKARKHVEFPGCLILPIFTD